VLMSYWAYILRSESSGRFYVGSAEDVERRLMIHNGPQAGWTRRYQPWVVVYREEFATRGAAVKRERELKRLKVIERYLEEIKRGRK
jgi:putative endonuclease